MEVLFSMSKLDQKILVQENFLKTQEQYLVSLIHELELDKGIIDTLVTQAREAIARFEQGDDSQYKIAEQITAIVKGYKVDKRRLRAEIKNQRRRVQWERKQLSSLRQQKRSAELS